MDFKTEIVIFLEKYGEKYAKVVIRPEGNNVYNIVHTYVSNEHRGEGLAAKITEEALKFIKSHNGKIKADCSYTYKYLEKNNIEMVPLDHSPACSLSHMKEDPK